MRPPPCMPMGGLRRPHLASQQKRRVVMPLLNSQRSNRRALIMGSLFALVGAVGAVGSWFAYSLDTGIEKSGPRAVGHITDKSMVSSSDGDSDFTVSYWFVLPGGERIEAERGVSKELWSTFRKGETLVVAYADGNPRRNFPSGAGVTSFGVTVFVSALSSVFAIFGSLLLLGALRRTSGEVCNYAR